MAQLSDSQLVVLSTACQRPDRSVYPLTAKLPGGAAAKVLSSLLNKGLIREVQAKREDTTWGKTRSAAPDPARDASRFPGARHRPGRGACRERR